MSLSNREITAADVAQVCSQVRERSTENEHRAAFLFIQRTEHWPPELRGVALAELFALMRSDEWRRGG